MGSVKSNYLEYPFGKRWVYASAFMSVLAIIFAIFMLSSEGILAIVLYSVCTFIFTIAILALKFYVYFLRPQSQPESYVDTEDMGYKKSLKQKFILLLIAAIIALFAPLLLLMLLSPLWWLISVASYVPAVNIPEIVLYWYARRSTN